MSCFVATERRRDDHSRNGRQSGTDRGVDRTTITHSPALLRRDSPLGRTRNPKLRTLLITVGEARVRRSPTQAHPATPEPIAHSGREGIIDLQSETAAAESGLSYENVTGR